MFRQVSRQLLGSLAIFAVLVGGCSPPGAEDEDATGDQQEEPDQAGEVAESDPAGDDSVLRTHFNRELTILDFHGPEGLSIPNVQSGRHIFDQLIARDQGEFVPAIATDWEAIDELTWEIAIRDDVEFHDGQPLTAADVAATIEHIASQDTPLANFWAQLERVEAVEEHRVRIQTTEPMGQMLTSLEMVLVAPASLIGTDEFREEPVGSGAFRFKEWTPGQILIVERNEDYWGETAGVATIEFHDIPEPAGRITSLITGELDIIFDIGPEDVETLEAAEGVTVVSGPAWPYYMIWPNHNLEEFTDERVRQALYHAVNTEEMIDSLLPGLAEPMRGPISSSATHAGEFAPYEYDPDRARELLAEAGYPDGFSTSIQWPSGDGPQIREVAMTLASYWNAIGLEVELHEREAGVWREHFTDATYDINLMAHSGSQGDAASTVGRLYHSNETRHGYADEETDAIIARAYDAVDEDEQVERWEAVQERIWAQAVGVWLIDLNGTFAVRDRVQDFDPPVDASRPLFHRVTVSD